MTNEELEYRASQFMIVYPKYKKVEEKQKFLIQSLSDKFPKGPPYNSNNNGDEPSQNLSQIDSQIKISQKNFSNKISNKIAPKKIVNENNNLARKSKVPTKINGEEIIKKSKVVEQKKRKYEVILMNDIEDEKKDKIDDDDDDDENVVDTSEDISQIEGNKIDLFVNERTKIYEDEIELEFALLPYNPEKYKLPIILEEKVDWMIKNEVNLYSMNFETVCLLNSDGDKLNEFEDSNQNI